MPTNNDNETRKHGLLTTSVVFPADIHHDRYFSLVEMRKRLMWQIQEQMAELMGIDIYGGKNLDIDPDRGSYTFQFLGITTMPTDKETLIPIGLMHEMKMYMLVLHNQVLTMEVGDVCIKSAIAYPNQRTYRMMPEVPVFSLSNPTPEVIVRTEVKQFEPRTLFIKGKIIEMWERIL